MSLPPAFVMEHNATPTTIATPASNMRMRASFGALLAKDLGD